MYSKEQEQLRMSLHQYFGSILKASNFTEPEKRKESLIALVAEELCKFCKDEKDNIDIKSAKPILKATNYLLTQRGSEMYKYMEEETSLNDEEIEDSLADINWLIQNLDKYIKTIN